MRIGLFGGTFDPFHNGHLHALTLFADAAQADFILVMPTGTPPHKEAERSVSDYDRLMMADLAVSRLGTAFADAYEIEKGGKSYTVETVEHLREQYPDCTVVLYTGSDMFLTLHQWCRASDLLSMVEVIACSRHGDDFEALRKQAAFLTETYGTDCRVLSDDAVPVSSTEIREKLRRGEDVSDLLPTRVLDYIRENNLYCGNAR